ncbi:protein-histidine N-methyltransferase [Aspergillus stella-maris]|uniref:protein-histidine N-methyltransferase n=1 Tax=Aspergillus stella-maris TaxID=1810926 RepID=UPI003CCCAE52
MASGFSFGFSGDDIDMDIEDTETNGIGSGVQQDNGASNLPELVKAQRHDMSEWLSTLPSQISYNKCTVTPSQIESNSAPVTVARRDVFDIRTQLMVEDSAEEQNSELIAGLEKVDITPNFYEGGFKTWECSIDLGGLVVDAENVEGGHVIELGAGTAVPSLSLFAQLLAQTESATTETTKTYLTLADYNSAVLRLVTLPNFLLTWNHYITNINTTPQTEGENEAEQQGGEEGYLDITPELLSRFTTDLSRRGIVLNFISGAWSPSFVDLVFASPELSSSKTLILASETIYSPASLGAFSETLLELLRRSSGESKALIAAKKVYFGVGGGIDEFLGVVKGMSRSELVVEERKDVKSEGVGRIILEVRVGK